MSLTTLDRPIHSLKPRHLEIMDRMLLNQSQQQIAKDLGMARQHVSIIQNSPLFKLELRKKLIRREEKFLMMEESILGGAVSGINKLKKFVEEDNPLHQREAFQSSMVLANLGVKLMDRNTLQQQQPQGEMGDQSYEERLQKVTVEQSIRTFTPLESEKERLEMEGNLDAILDDCHPPLEGLLSDEGELIEIEDETMREMVRAELEEELSTSQPLPNNGNGNGNGGNGGGSIQKLGGPPSTNNLS